MKIKHTLIWVCLPVLFCISPAAMATGAVKNVTLHVSFDDKIQKHFADTRKNYYKGLSFWVAMPLASPMGVPAQTLKTAQGPINSQNLPFEKTLTASYSGTNYATTAVDSCQSNGGASDVQCFFTYNNQTLQFPSGTNIASTHYESDASCTIEWVTAINTAISGAQLDANNKPQKKLELRLQVKESSPPEFNENGDRTTFGVISCTHTITLTDVSS